MIEVFPPSSFFVFYKKERPAESHCGRTVTGSAIFSKERIAFSSKIVYGRQMNRLTGRNQNRYGLQ